MAVLVIDLKVNPKEFFFEENTTDFQDLLDVEFKVNRANQEGDWSNTLEEFCEEESAFSVVSK